MAEMRKKITLPYFFKKVSEENWFGMPDNEFNELKKSLKV
jgi:hypothetical protein